MEVSLVILNQNIKNMKASYYQKIKNVIRTFNAYSLDEKFKVFAISNVLKKIA